MNKCSDSLPNQQQRILSIDALRGYAIASLMLLHATQHFSYHEYVTYELPWVAVWNQSIRDVLVFLFTEKSFCIFTFLFGFTFHLLYSKQVRLGGDLTWRFAWRMLILLGFGYINVAFFPGDVLISYALCGLILIPLRSVSTPILLGVAACFLILPGEWYMGIRSLLDSSYVPFDNGYLNNYAPMKVNMATGSWLTTWWSNISLGSYAGMGWKFDMGRIAQTCALFILGYLAGRTRRFEDSERNHQFWMRLFCGSFVLAVLLYPISCGMKELFVEDARMQPFKDIASSWYNLCLTALTVSLFLTLYRCATFRAITKPFSIYGKASLSNYMGQSVIGACIFYPAGLGLAPELGMAASSIIAVVVIALQITATYYYLKHFQRGPLESLWHRLTWIGGGRK